MANVGLPVEFVQEISNMKQVITTLNEEMKSIRQSISALKLNEQNFIESNVPITPGIGSKFAFDKNGLIIKAEKLSSDDLPDIQIDKVLGLRKLLDNKLSEDQVNKIIEELLSDIPKRSSVVSDTGVKINYDENGFVISSGNLLVDDIPELPASKISGLESILEMVKEYNEYVNQNTNKPVEVINITSGTACKISYDSHGNVIKGEKLSTEDLPVDFVTNVNSIQNMISSLAKQSTVDGINKLLMNKLDIPVSKVKPGVYTRVIIDENGLVTQGYKLDKSDLPELNINDISELASSLNSKANASDVIEIRNTLAQIISLSDKINEINSIKLNLDNKADIDSISKLESRFNTFENKLNKLLSVIPNDTIEMELNNLHKEVTDLSGKISVLEQKVTQLMK